MNTEDKEAKANATSQTADDRQTEDLADLPVAVEQTEEVKGGPSGPSGNNLKQMTLA